MIELLLENAAVSALADALGDPRISVSGFWSPAPDGTAKGEEDPSSLGALSVVVKPRAFESFTTPKANISVAIALAVREDMDPRRENLAALAARLVARLQAWQTSIDAVRADFTVAGFTPSGFRLDGGDASFDDLAASAVFSQSFTLRGIVTSTTT